MFTSLTGFNLPLLEYRHRPADHAPAARRRGRSLGRHDIVGLTAISSLRANGQFRPVAVGRPTNQVLGGNHLVEAARGLGWSEIAATYVDVDEERARRIVLADNRTSDLATYDDAPDQDDVETVVDLWFRELDGSTEVAFSQGPFKTEERRSLHRDGWTETFDKLEHHLRASRRSGA